MVLFTFPFGANFHRLVETFVEELLAKREIFMEQFNSIIIESLIGTDFFK